MMGFHDLDFILSLIYDAWSQVERCDMVIVINIWQKLSSVERRITIIDTNIWRLFS